MNMEDGDVIILDSSDSEDGVLDLRRKRTAGPAVAAVATATAVGADNDSQEQLLFPRPPADVDSQEQLVFPRLANNRSCSSAQQHAVGGASASEANSTLDVGSRPAPPRPKKKLRRNVTFCEGGEENQNQNQDTEFPAPPRTPQRGNFRNGEGKNASGLVRKTPNSAKSSAPKSSAKRSARSSAKRGRLNDEDLFPDGDVGGLSLTAAGDARKFGFFVAETLSEDAVRRWCVHFGLKINTSRAFLAGKLVQMLRFLFEDDFDLLEQTLAKAVVPGFGAGSGGAASAKQVDGHGGEELRHAEVEKDAALPGTAPGRDAVNGLADRGQSSCQDGQAQQAQEKTIVAALKSNAELWERMLCFEPVQPVEVQSILRNAGIKIGLQPLIELLEKQAVVYSK